MSTKDVPEPSPGRDFSVFVVGCERSGTTLLRTILDGHHRLAIPPESYFPLEWLRRRHLLAPTGRPDLTQLADLLAVDERFKRWKLDLNGVRQHWAMDVPANLPAAIRSVFRCYATREGKQLFGDKTPVFVTAIPELAAAFPESRFVHIVRDGRDVALSLVERAHQPPHMLSDAAIFWAKRVLAGQFGGTVVGPDRYCVVRYEDLIEAPEHVIRRLCDFLMLEFDFEMLSYTKRGERAAAAFDFPEYHAHLTKPPTRGLRDWRQVMSRRDQELFQQLAGDVLRQHGYSPGATPSTCPRRAALWLRVVSAQTGFRIRSRGRRLRSALQRTRGNER